MSDGHRGFIQEKLESEATLVIHEYEQGIHEHSQRIASCRAFLKLVPNVRQDLLNQIRVCANTPNILEIDGILNDELRNIARPDKRRKIINRLREYWMNRVCLSLTGEMPRHITKAEIQQRMEELANTIAGNGLPDDYGTLQPPSEADVPDIMRRQIELVAGGNSRINRAKAVHWKSRNQRQKWLEDDVSMAPRLNEFDTKLVNIWNDRHGPMCDDTKAESEKEKQRHGCALLDWSHNDAPQWPISIGRGPVPVYVTQGTYQDLANDLRVGWHPDYKDRLPSAGEPE